ncbi:8-amino-7-oxononanoate synthase [Pedobacter yulinensis]|uniref:8-amino-7-oxononanoate synthase n=1 Tax=Pedobacter yulinensis TaxID=2126353 RepID=A0A2T3HKM5_9SPHI|nr:8-amino-7-oxononanoate synthase [Pedobacter yulinensis]PST82980.1 8-amino-7-oxononanoate synthase [Pedobacter yulinensis]
MTDIQRFIESKLNSRREAGLLRQLKSGNPLYDFCSNDYLGFARNDAIYKRASALAPHFGPYLNGSGGSRLLSGNHAWTEETEATIASFHGFERALLFNSGYDANLGLLSSLLQRGDTVITDELIHASLIDGARLSLATRQRFAHNEPMALEARLRQARGNCYVVIESIYSMDGDTAPLADIAALCRRYGAGLIVDEAHAIGVLGKQGRGLVAELGLQEQVLACVYTYGKAMGTHGAAICGNNLLHDYLVNFARSFIYTTAAPPHAVTSIFAAYQELAAADYQARLRQKTTLFDQLCTEASLPNPGGGGAIRSLSCPGNKNAASAACAIQSAGFDVRAIRSPTVAAGSERLRICLHTFNTEAEITTLVNTLSNIFK